MNSPEEVANMLQAKWQLKLNGGVLVTNPIPEEDSLDEEVMNNAIDEALIETGDKLKEFDIYEMMETNTRFQLVEEKMDIKVIIHIFFVEI